MLLFRQHHDRGPHPRISSTCFPLRHGERRTERDGLLTFGLFVDGLPPKYVSSDP